MMKEKKINDHCLKILILKFNSKIRGFLNIISDFDHGK